MDMDAVLSLAAIATVILTIVALILVMPESRRPQLKGFGLFLHDLFNFRYLIIEKIMKAIYCLLTIGVVCFGFFAIFSEDIDAPLAGLAIMVLGPVALRIVYETIMMGILLVKNVISINAKMADNAGNAQPNAFEYQVPKAPAAPVKASVVEEKEDLCPNCGAKYEKGSSFCIQCGTKREQ